jgi:hypothetical protein
VTLNFCFLPACEVTQHSSAKIAKIIASVLFFKATRYEMHLKELLSPPPPPRGGPLSLVVEKPLVHLHWYLRSAMTGIQD